MTALLLAALALASPDYDLSWKGGMSCSDGDCTLPGDTLSFDCNTCPCLIYQESETTDAHGCGITEHAGHAFGTSKDGGDLTLCGGDASHSIATTAAIAAGDTVTTSIDGTALVALTEGVDFDCSGTDDTCAASLCAAIEAQSGVSCSGTTSPINPQVDEDKCTVSFAFADGAADGVVGVDTTGDVGEVSVPYNLYIGGSSSNGMLINNTSTYVNFRNGTDTAYRNLQAGYFVGTQGVVSRVRMVLGTGELSIYPSNGSPEGSLSAVGGSLALDYTNFDLYVKATASGNTGWILSGSIAAVKGATTEPDLNVVSVTFDANPGNASKTTSGLCPANSIVHGITYRVATAATNCASVEIGDGTDVDMFGTAQSITQGTTGDISDYTDQATRVNVYTAAGFEATVTANGGNCFGGVWRFTCHYTQLTADTAN
jgi:hypothetical protein